MSHIDTSTLVLRLSCVLSILGATVVMLCCFFPADMRKKTGRRLLFYLSLSDCLASIIYFASTFEHDNDHNTPACQAFAVLGIFFPVASFLWTDFIAYYLYTMIVQRKYRSEKEKEELMRYFHILAWGISGLCILLVLVFHHAGRNSSDHSGGVVCWVRGQTSKNLFIWELVGGKFIEWLSCFIILPAFYFFATKKLIGMESSLGPLDPCTVSPPSALTSNSWANSFTNCALREPLMEYGPRDQRALLEGSSDIQPKRHLSSGVVRGKAMRFRKFYLKMMAVPIVFMFVRVWGSVRTIIEFVCAAESAASAASDSWLHIMQAFFDPSQGFFNALLFVLTSEEDTDNLISMLRSVPVLGFLVRIICIGDRRHDSNPETSITPDIGPACDGYRDSESSLSSDQFVQSSCGLPLDERSSVLTADSVGISARD